MKKKKGLLVSLILGGTLKHVFNFLKFIVLLCEVRLKEKKYDFWKKKKKICKHDTTIKKKSRTLPKSENQDLDDSFKKSFSWINL